MAHELQTTHDESFEGTLTLAEHPDGSLVFEDGSAPVEDERIAARIAQRYPNIERAGASSAESEDGSPAEETVADPPLDPGEHTIDDLEAELDGEFSDAELQAILDAEEAGEDRSGATDAIEAQLDS